MAAPYRHPKRLARLSRFFGAMKAYRESLCYMNLGEFARSVGRLQTATEGIPDEVSAHARIGHIAQTRFQARNLLRRLCKTLLSGVFLAIIERILFGRCVLNQRERSFCVLLSL